jgi:UV DNA damage endonuclease
MIYLGFPVRILGRPGLRAYDGRRRASGPHLSVSLAYLRDVVAYLAGRSIRCYRLSDALAPYLTYGASGSYERQIEECGPELAEVGAQIRAAGLRLTMHLGMHIALGAEDGDRASWTVAELVAQSALLDGLGAGPEAVLVVHVGGMGGGTAVLHRFARRYGLLPPTVRRRVVVEQDDRVWSLQGLLQLHQTCGVPVVFDYLHHMLNNPEQLPLPAALALALATWPEAVRPKIHFSSPRTEAHLGPAGSQAVLPPRPGQHADFINPFEFAALLRIARPLSPFDIMLEAKGGDLALLRLRDDLAAYAPDVAGMVQ